MNDRPPLLIKKPFKSMLISKNMLIRRYFKNTSAERPDFACRYKSRISVHKKVKLHAIAIDVSIVVHYYLLDTTANHFSYDLGNTDRLAHHISSPVQSERSLQFG